MYKYANSFKQARHFHRGRNRPVRLIVLHSAETGEKGSSAEGVQNYFLNPDAPASAHLTIDTDSCAQSVKLTDTAFAAKGANADGVHLEHAGRARQSRAEWLDEYSRPMLTFSACITADLIQSFDLTPKFLNAKDLRNPKMLRGITTHAEISEAWPSNGHHDPGKGYPLDSYLGWVEDALAGRLAIRVAFKTLEVADAVRVEPRVLKLTSPMMRGDDVAALQRKLKIKADGIYGPGTDHTVAVARRRHKLAGPTVVDSALRKVLGL